MADWIHRKRICEYSILVQVPKVVLVLLDTEKAKEEQSPLIFIVDLCY